MGAWRFQNLHTVWAQKRGQEMRRKALAAAVGIAIVLAAGPAAAIPEAVSGRKYVGTADGYFLLSIPADEYTVETDAIALLFDPNFVPRDCLQLIQAGETLDMTERCEGLYLVFETDVDGKKLPGSFSFTLISNTQPAPADTEEEDSPSSDDEAPKPTRDDEAPKPTRMVFTGEPFTPTGFGFFLNIGTWRIRNFKEASYKIYNFGTNELCVSSDRPRKIISADDPACNGHLLLVVTTAPATNWRIWITRID